MTLPLVIVSHRLPDSWLEPLRGRCEIAIGPSTTEVSGLSEGLAARLADAEGLLSLLTVRVSDELLARAGRLRVVSNMAVGVDNVDVAACTRRGIPVGHTPGVLTAATADLTMALLLSSARQLPKASADARAGRWTTWLPDGWLGADLDGATLGIVGLGQIGAAVAARAHGFGLRLTYAGPRRRPDLEESLGLSWLSFDALLATSDFVTLHVPLRPETRGLINESALRLMKPTAILINAARGPVVDPAALYRALSEGWIAGAALDVTDPEPLPAGHPLYSLDNCLIVPHIGSATHRTRQQMALRACQNLLAGLEGRRLPYCVNPSVYDSLA